MSTMHKRLIAIAAVLVAVTVPACAQRGGGHSAAMGHSGGFAVHSAPAIHSNFLSTPVRSSFSVPSQFNSSRYTANHITGSGYPGHRPGYVGDNRYRYRRPYNPVYGLGLPYGVGYGVGYIPDYLDYADSAAYDSPTYAPPQPQAADYYGPPSQEQYPAPPDQADAAPAPSYRPAYQRPPPPPDPEPGLPVTLVFKDGRPNEQIQNYMLTRTTLYVQGQRLRTIPVDQLDLAAMNKINGDAGVEFNLPGSTQ
jgi:hypothetical protein